MIFSVKEQLSSEIQEAPPLAGGEDVTSWLNFPFKVTSKRKYPVIFCLPSLTMRKSGVSGFPIGSHVMIPLRLTISPITLRHSWILSPKAPRPIEYSFPKNDFKYTSS